MASLFLCHASLIFVVFLLCLFMLNSSMDVPFPFKENQSAIDQCIAYLVWANVSLAFALIKSS